MPLTKPWNQLTKIVCTMGPGLNTALIERLIKAGMDVARFNLSHGTQADHADKIRIVRELADKLGRNIAILIDLPGPKYRIGELKTPSVILKKGAQVILSNSRTSGDEKILSLNFPTLHKDVTTGNIILLDDGAMQLKVLEIRGTEIICRVVVGGILTPRRGVVVPGAKISEPFLTADLRKNLIFAMEQNADYIALSFVSSAEDVLNVKEILKHKNCQAPIIAKIEREEAVHNLDKILEASDGMMVARGDLGVEMPLKEVPLIQKNIIRRCNIAGKPVITATQMLESMINSPRPTRAEVSDVANAILDGTDAIMLSAETSIGKYPVQAVKTMYDIALVTEKHLHHDQILASFAPYLADHTDELISYNACHTAEKLKVKAIVAVTQSGSTARRVSRFRPHMPVIAITPNKDVIRRLVLNWGVYAFFAETPTSLEKQLDMSAKLVKKLGIAKSGDLIVITGGIPVGVAGTTNLLKVHQVP
jgi:pyruvate kinase